MPRKTHALTRASSAALHASMRPRPDAAENAAVGRAHLEAAQSASMRPRPDAAENFHASGRKSTLRRLQ